MWLDRYISHGPSLPSFLPPSIHPSLESKPGRRQCNTLLCTAPTVTSVLPDVIFPLLHARIRLGFHIWRQARLVHRVGSCVAPNGLHHFHLLVRPLVQRHRQNLQSTHTPTIHYTGCCTHTNTTMLCQTGARSLLAMPTLDMCTPRLRCTPEHLMQIKTPMLVDLHSRRPSHLLVAWAVHTRGLETKHGTARHDWQAGRQGRLPNTHRQQHHLRPLGIGSPAVGTHPVVRKAHQALELGHGLCRQEPARQSVSRGP